MNSGSFDHYTVCVCECIEHQTLVFPYSNHSSLPQLNQRASLNNDEGTKPLLYSTHGQYLHKRARMEGKDREQKHI